VLTFFTFQVIANLIWRRLADVDIGSTLQVLTPDLLAHAASVHPSSERSPVVPSRDFDSSPALPRAVLSKARCLRSGACVAVPPDSPCCAARPPVADSAQVCESSATAESWVRINLQTSRRALTKMRGLASTFRSSQTSGFN